MQNFTPMSGLIGGLMIGCSAAFFLLVAGRISGISGILSGALAPADGERLWRIVYLAGLPLGVLVVTLLVPGVVAEPVMSTKSWPLIIGAGLLVGFGARLAGGCTSGHGVCGIPRFSARSITATLVFMGTAATTVYVVRHLL